MSLPKFVIVTLSLAAAISALPEAAGQTLPASLSFSVSGKFQNGVSESSNSILIGDNNLTNGYNYGADLTDAPSGFRTSGPSGSTFFQWGRANTASGYAHPSALWFEPAPVTTATAEKAFSLGYLYFRNGTIDQNSGASAVDLALTFDFSKPSGMAAMNTVFTGSLVNTPNTGSPVGNTDIASFGNPLAPLTYKDSKGNTYYLSLSFKMDAAAMTATRSNPREFHSLEGSVGKAELIGIFTTSSSIAPVPEASAALLGAVGSLILFRRQRRA